MSQDMEKDRIIDELIACQRRVRELEKSAAGRQEEIATARGEFESLFELSPDALVLVDRRGRIARVNASAERLFGYTRQELVGSDHDTLLVPEGSRDRHSAEMKRFMQHPRIRVMGTGLELRGRRKDGSEFAADIDLGPVEIGKEFFVLSVVRDATQRKRLEENLQESEKRYHDLVERLPDGIVVHSEGTIVFANAAVARLLGMRGAEQVVGRPITEFVHPDYRAAAGQRIRQTTDEGKMAPVLQGKFTRADGTAFFADVISMPYTHRNKPATLSILRDVTERKQAEDTIREQQERFRTIVQTALDGFWINDLQGRLLYVNDSYCHIIGYSREELLSMRIQDLEAAETPAGTAEHIERIIRAGGDRFETRHRRKDGAVIDMEVSVNYRDVEGGRFFVFLRDITERKHAEAALENYRSRLETAVAQRTAEFARANERLSQEMEEHRKTEEGLILRATILDHAQEAVFLLNPRGDFVYANEAAIRTYGYARDEFLVMNIRQMVRPQEQPALAERLETVLRTGQMEIETLHVRKDKSLVPVEVRHSLIKTLHGQFIVSVMRDATAGFRLRSLLAQMPVMLWTTDSQLTLTSTAGSGLEMLGLKRDEGVGLSLVEYFERNGLAGDVLTVHQRALAGELIGFRFGSGKLGRTFRGWVAPLRDSEGEVSGTIGTALEIPE